MAPHRTKIETISSKKFPICMGFVMNVGALEGF